jgi:hypothetical protein
MTFKVVRNAQGVAVAFGPNDDNYEPSEAYTVEESEPVFVPPVAPISPRQIRQALTRAGLRNAVEAAVSAGDQDLKDWYEFSTAFERLNPQVIAMGEALSVSPSSLDDLWALGASL